MGSNMSMNDFSSDAPQCLESLMRRNNFSRVMRSANIGLARNLTTARTRVLHMRAEKRRFSDIQEQEQMAEFERAPIKYFFVRMSYFRTFLILTVGLLMGAYLATIIMESCGIVSPLPQTKAFSGKARVIYRFITTHGNIGNPLANMMNWKLGLPKFLGKAY